MAFFMLFNVPKDTEYHKFKKDLSGFGEINFFKLNDDLKNKDFKFGQLDYSKISNKNDLIDFFKSHKIEHIEKESKQQTNKNNNQQKDKFKSQNKNNKPKQPIKSIENPSFYFYKDEAYGKDIEKFKFENNYEELFKIKDSKTFELTTSYPGLLVGSGYNHPKLKEKTDDFQLGFFFDHTTGLPIISGSSIKGMLKSVCKNIEFMEDVYETTIPLEIFEDNKTIFYDAFILSTANNDKNIFGSDYITNHYSDEKNGEFKSPNPIKFLKILPEVTFRFLFKCDEKYLDIFRSIILDFGLGAKTNTGYGKFIK